MSTTVAPILGGALIGLAAALVLLAHGRIAGVSSIVAALLGRPSPGFGFRMAFLSGLLAAGAGVALLAPEALPSAQPGLVLAGVGGLLVGYGTRLGGGCTSGHGVCGVGRLSRRSIVATAVFVLTGAITVFIVRHVFGGGTA